MGYELRCLSNAAKHRRLHVFWDPSEASDLKSCPGTSLRDNSELLNGRH